MNEKRDFCIKEYKRTGNVEFRNELLKDNIDFIKKQVNFLCFDSRYKKDFEQEAMLGFLEALDRFRPGGNFNTCVFWGIKKRILNFYRKSKSFVKITNRYDILLSTVKKVKAKFFETHNREMTDEDLREVLSAREMHVWELSQGENHGLEHIENLKEFSVDDSVHREKNEEESLNKDYLKQILDEMPENERWLIKARYGIDTTKQNLTEIGVFLKKTPQRIEQMQRAIERKIKKRLNLRHRLVKNSATV